MPSVFDIPDDELTDAQRVERSLRSQKAQAEEQAALDRSQTAHYATRVTALRAHLDEALETVARLEAELEVLKEALPKKGAQGAAKKAAASTRRRAAKAAVAPSK